MSDLRKLGNGFTSPQERQAWVRRWDWIGEQIGETGISVEDMHDEVLPLLDEKEFMEFEQGMYRMFVQGNDSGVVDLVSSYYIRKTMIN